MYSPARRQSSTPGLADAARAGPAPRRTIQPVPAQPAAPAAAPAAQQFSVASGVNDPYLNWISQRQGQVSGFNAGRPFGADGSFGTPYTGPAGQTDANGFYTSTAPPSPNMADAAAVIAADPPLSAMQAAGVKNILIPNPNYGANIPASEGQGAVNPGPFILNPATTAGWRIATAPAPNGQTVQALIGPNGQVAQATHYNTPNSSMHAGDSATAAAVLGAGFGAGQLLNTAAGGALAGGAAAAAPTADSVAASGIGTGMADAGTVAGTAGGAGAAAGAATGAAGAGLGAGAGQVVNIVAPHVAAGGLTAGQVAAGVAGGAGLSSALQSGAAPAGAGAGSPTSPSAPTGTQVAPDQTVNVSAPSAPSATLPSNIPGATAGGAAALTGLENATMPTVDNVPAGPGAGPSGTSGLTPSQMAALVKQYGPIVGQLFSGVQQYQASQRNSSTVQQAQQLALDAGKAQLQFAATQHANQQPLLKQLNDQATTTNAGQQLSAAQQQAAGASQLNDVTKSFSPVNQQVGLNAMGAQNLSAAQVTQLQQAQQTLASSTDPAARAQAQATIQGLQKAAESTGIGLEQAKAALVTQTAANQGQAVTGAYNQNANATQQIGANLAAGVNQVAGNTAAGTIANANTDANSILANAGTSAAALDAAGADRLGQQTGFYGAQAQNVLDTAKQRAIDFERDQTNKANADISNSANQAQREMLRLGGDPNRMAAMALDTANQQQLARVSAGNQIGATNIANLNAAHDQALGLQQTGFNAGTQQQYALGNQALGIKSSALDAARAARTAAAQTALGITSGAATQGLQTVASANQSAADKTLQGTTAGQGVTFAGQNQGVAITNAAKNTVDAQQNALLAQAGGLGTQVSNAGSQATAVGTAAGTAGVNNLNTSAQGSVPMTNAVTNANNSAIASANSANNSIYGATSAANSQSSATGNLVSGAIGLANNFGTSTLPSAIGGAGSSIDSSMLTGIGQAASPAITDTTGAVLNTISSSKKVKTNFGKVDPQAAVAGLEQAMPKTYDYKPGNGTPGRKIGPMAEDMHKQFGDAVAPRGKVINVQNTLGLQHAAIVGLSQRVKQLEKRA